MASGCYIRRLSLLSGVIQLLILPVTAHGLTLPSGMPKNPSILIATSSDYVIPGLKYLAGTFEQQTGIHVSVQTMPNENFGMWMDTQFLARNPPELMMRDFLQGINKNGSDGVLYNLSKAINQPNPFSSDPTKPWGEYFRPPFITTTRDVNNQLWAIPFTSSGYAFYYNKDIYAKYHLEPPKTWDEFMKQSILLKQHGVVPTRISYVHDQQEYFISDQLNNEFFRAKTPLVHLQHAKDWKFDPNNPETVAKEHLSLEEKIVAFEKGITDPARAPEYKQLAKLMQAFSKTWNDNFDTQMGGQTLFEEFLKGNTASIYAATGELNNIMALSEKIKITDPSRYFQIGFFPFPELSKATTGNLRIAGGMNQRVIVNSFVAVTKQKEAWREQAALLFLQYITLPENTQKLFQTGKVYAISTLRGVTGPQITENFNYQLKYADMNIGAAGGGYDDTGDIEWAILDKKFLTGHLTLKEYLAGLSESQRNSLLRLAKDAGSDLNQGFIRQQLGKDFK